jgi:LmbE family N-acetylglucosaminyl deacetylase
VTGGTCRALFIFAHQDDEYAAAPWLVEELGAGSAIACVYLTSGGLRVAPEVRDEESRRTLRSLGVPHEAIVFLANGNDRIADQGLAAQSIEGLAWLENWIAESGFVPTRIYAPSYEGGHHDHDAAHLIAAVIASERRLTEDAWHFAIYNAYRCPRPFFSTLKQLPTKERSRKPSMPRARRLALSVLCRRYRSQRRTWLGLFPGAFLERAVLARETVVRFDLARVMRRPHDGELLYERLFGLSYAGFEDRVAGLRSRLSLPRDVVLRERPVT